MCCRANIDDGRHQCWKLCARIESFMAWNIIYSFGEDTKTVLALMQNIQCSISDKMGLHTADKHCTANDL